MFRIRPSTALLAALVVVLTSHGRAQSVRAFRPQSAILDNGRATSVAAAGSSISALAWTAPAKGTSNSLGGVSLTTADGQTNPLLRVMVKLQTGALVCQGASWNAQKTLLTISFLNGTQVMHVSVGMEGQDKAAPVPQFAGLDAPDSKGDKREFLAATIDADQAGIISLAAMQVSDSTTRKAIPIPYYDQPIFYLGNLSQFTTTWWDWHATSASAIRGGTVQYSTKTDGTLNRVHEQLEIVISPNLDAVLPVPGATPSPYKSVLSGRTVLDIWDKGFRPVQQGLADLADFGLQNCAVIIHMWQAAGYDNALPEHFPADPRLGGNSGLQAAIAQAKQSGCLVALHENYVDYYPNYPNFDQKAIALNSDGSQMKSFLNRGTGIQSFATKPGWMVPNAKTQSPAIHQTLGTTADYLDVNSAVWPSWHGDMDANVPTAAMLTTFFHNNAALWAYERTAHNGPVFGEGNEHWYYSGLLDGVEAQLGAGATKMNIGETLPLFVDFDLLSIHPLQVNHGMGYYSRWIQPGASMFSLQMDAYRMQEIAFGHAPFLGQGVWNDLSKALVEFNLVAPVAARYSMEAADSIRYYVDGQWVSSSVAAPAGRFETVQVTYHNGLKVVANSGPAPVKWNKLTIPQYGWAAQGPDLLAYTAECGDAICDYAQTPSSLFANARNQDDARVGWAYAEPSVVSTKHGSGTDLVLSYQWKIYRPLPADGDFKTFVHFINDQDAAKGGSAIALQDGHQSPMLLSHASQAGQVLTDGPITVKLPPSLPDGTYSVRMGIYNAASGDRVLLSGDDDGGRRYTVGHITVSQGATQATFTPPSGSHADARLNNSGSLVNFGTVQTDGMVSLVQKDGRWLLRPFPRHRNFTVLFNAAAFPVPRVISSSNSTASSLVPVVKGNYWLCPMNGSASYSWPIHASGVRSTASLR